MYSFEFDTSTRLMIFFKVISFDSPFTSSNKIKKQHVKKKPNKTTNKHSLKQIQVKNLKEKIFYFSSG